MMTAYRQKTEEVVKKKSQSFDPCGKDEGNSIKNMPREATKKELSE
jgi:hypothetical protein